MLWEAARFEKIALSAQAERHGLAYVVGRSGIVSDLIVFDLGGREGRTGWPSECAIGVRCGVTWNCE